LGANYVYWLGEVERNHERYVHEHAVVASPALEKLAQEHSAQITKGRAA